jgi:hypothetical protein
LALGEEELKTDRELKFGQRKRAMQGLSGTPAQETPLF